MFFRARRGKREISVKKALGTRPTQGEEHEKFNPSICKYLASHKFHPLAKELNTEKLASVPCDSATFNIFRLVT